ncbi:MAG: DJ-1/PfpI family protein [Verrucomicrobia bacterium]|nr:DJ-1/PfpI family protein [Verrucomicrobiota bacterium]
MPSIVVPLAEGVEEMEAVIVIDVLRRASLDVVSAAIGDSRTVTASRGVVLLADTLWSSIVPNNYDAIVLPGGAGGSERLCEHTGVLEAIRGFHSEAKLVAAVCAGPLALQAAGVLTDCAATCHPAVAKQLTATSRRTERVVRDGNVITSQGPGTTFEFALAIIEQLCDREAVSAVADGLILP